MFFLLLAPSVLCDKFFRQFYLLLVNFLELLPFFGSLPSFRCIFFYQIRELVGFLISMNLISFPVKTQSLVARVFSFRGLSMQRSCHVSAKSQLNCFCFIDIGIVHELVSGSALGPYLSCDQETFIFGDYNIDKRQVFLTTKLSFALVNIRPVVPGHVLVCPKRVVKRFVDLSVEETSDLWLAAKQIGAKLENHFGASSLTFVIQDGPEAGQTVPHVHVHILPRQSGDFEKNDEIYDAVEGKEVNRKLDLDEDRKNRTITEMSQEASFLRALF
ncbi:bifunctional bis(5'-adenosyl)-triphosphatase/adenylylsulfatase FHIT isoform X2 [Amborella trichopoda]|uniref:bifunctional bis(5'-adenosyl)-triphosphatase/adenylylsulfatase FHIT isoform X2 n=1 Tax=Amborella trichopoda TaxID=13333 RepID=UPI0009C09D08|nr:bifunctional bis(5'-adenosyl)-triphosphatase/adenylylsulfatase FHIT isoform X2 [Amborella trichopoda]|eukprot:XP_020525914.1 bifunctional bis(5'-adenosyl)-triphosphatase/adenylylsulfatase FHIT isoform X2 [Amborella trichopoda]